MATSTVAPAEQNLQHSMSQLEAALLAPVVSGELKSWTQSVLEALNSFGPLWLQYVKTVLHPQYNEIAKTDNDLLRRVEQMIQEDQQLVTEFNELQQRVEELVKRADEVQKHESKAAEDRENVEQTGIALIVRIKKQQSAAATWMYEAQYRERGAGD
jgi:methyl-accepting chemotaxis protein